MISVEAYLQVRKPAALTDPRYSLFLAQAQEALGKELGLHLNRAISLLILHWMAMDDRDTAGNAVPGMIQEEREGQLGRKYLQDFTLSGKQSDLCQTRYGMELISLKKSAVFCPRTLTMEGL